MASSPEDLTSGILHTLADLRHIQNKHVRCPEEGKLWSESLGGRTDCDALRIFLAPEIEISLAKPMYLEYDQFEEMGSFQHHSRELMTRSGLVVVLRLVEDCYWLKTAFFPHDTFDEKPHRRYLAAIRSRIKLYAVWETFDQARRSIVIPTASHEVTPKGQVVKRRNIRFHSERSWGFRPEVIEGETVHVWHGPGAWPV